MTHSCIFNDPGIVRIYVEPYCLIENQLKSLILNYPTCLREPKIMSREAWVWPRAGLFLIVAAPKALSGHTCQINAVFFLWCVISKSHGPVFQFVSLQSPSIPAAWDSQPSVLIEGNNYFREAYKHLDLLIFWPRLKTILLKVTSATFKNRTL